MGRIILTLMLMFIMVFSGNAQATKENIDWKTIEQVEANAAAQYAVESLHNEQVDSIKKRQNKLLELVATLASYKELFQLTLENAKGFGQESGIYKNIVGRCMNIANLTVSATDALMTTNFNGKAISAIKIGELALNAASLGNLFFNVVCNGTVENPLKMEGMDDKKDKLNLLNRAERLNMAISINMELMKIEEKLRVIEYYCKHNSFGMLLINLDRKTFATLYYGRSVTNQLINRWKGLSE